MLSIQRYFVFKYKQAYIEDDDDFKVLSTSQFEAHLKMAPLVIFFDICSTYHKCSVFLNQVFQRVPMLLSYLQLHNYDNSWQFVLQFLLNRRCLSVLLPRSTCRTPRPVRPPTAPAPVPGACSNPPTRCRGTTPEEVVVTIQGVL